MKYKFISVLSLLLFYQISFSQTGCGNIVLEQTTWRAVLITPGGELPFELILSGQKFLVCKATFINNKEHIITDKIIMGDSLKIISPVFNTEIIAKLSDDTVMLTGHWNDYSRPGNYYLPFNAELIDQNKIVYRFHKNPLPPKSNISGHWDAVFQDEETTDSTVGIFEQTGNHLTGTFLTTTGDYRFLEGDVNADSFFLSAFDGSHAFLFKGKIHDYETLSGAFWSGNHYHATFTATRNEHAQLPDAKTLTYLKDGYTKIDFTLPDENGKIISLKDAEFENKPVVILITGSWCPNCMDEASYMSEVEEKFKNTDLKIIALQFERQTDSVNYKNNITKLRNHFGIAYPMLNAGSNRNAGAALPMLNRVVGFPTSIILNRQHDVVEIYTGFSGPATGELFVTYQQDFEALLKRLIE